MSRANVNQDALGKLANSCDDIQIRCYEKSTSLLKEIGDKCNEIIARGREISYKLGEARDKLGFAKSSEVAAEIALGAAQLLLPPWRAPAVAAATLALTIAINHRKKCEKRVSLLEEALSVYQAQGRRLKTRLDDTHFQLKSLLVKYAENNSVLHRRLNLASRDLEEYFLPIPSIGTMDFDFQRENVSIPLSHFEDQYKKMLEKEKFCIDESAKEKYGIEYSQYNLPVFPSLFDFAIAEENLRKDPNFHYAEGIKKLQKMLAEDQELHSCFSFDQIEQINDGMTPRGYVWYHDPNPPLGRLQLVNEEILLAIKTPKGYDLWQKILKKS